MRCSAPQLCSASFLCAAPPQNPSSPAPTSLPRTSATTSPNLAHLEPQGAEGRVQEKRGYGARRANRVRDGAGEAAEEQGAAADAQHGDGAVGGEAGAPGAARRLAAGCRHWDGSRWRHAGGLLLLLRRLIRRGGDGGLLEGVRPMQPPPRARPRHLHLQVALIRPSVFSRCFYVGLQLFHSRVGGIIAISSSLSDYCAPCPSPSVPFVN
jgi:hypothetical protein